ncbi:MAG: DNA mismatch repair protein MutS [Bdellovibrionales bacterium]|nr:DNA mismatch repair protein MutS [Bdellovibrionales bacterium]
MNQLSFADQKALTPLMRQYMEIKKQCPEAILFFRLGDFYEMFFEDAKIAAPVLDIALTSRDKNAKDPIPLCGVPYHSATAYITKLLDAGFKVAVCEQVEEPQPGKKIVERKIVRIITPGIRSDEEGLRSEQVNYIASIYQNKDVYTVCWIDVHAGTVEYASCLNLVNVKQILSTVSPSEVVTFAAKESTDLVWNKEIQRIDTVSFDQAKASVLKKYGLNHESVLGLSEQQDVFFPLYMLFEYIEKINLFSLHNILSPREFKAEQYLQIDEVTQKNLELFSQTSENLFSLLNQTKTGPGARLLFQWIKRPLRNVSEITKRYDLIDDLISNPSMQKDFVKLVKEVRDLERLMSRIQSGKAFVRDLVSIRQTLEQIPLIQILFTSDLCKNWNKLSLQLLPLTNLHHALSATIEENPSATLEQGGVIAQGVDKTLDHYRYLSKESKTWIASLQESERKRTGISSLKIGYNKVFGYYLEITNAHKDKVPSEYIRKQTLANAERYITPDLKAKEEEILQAKEKIREIETSIFQSLVKQCGDQSKELLHNANILSQMDVLQSLAKCALDHQYVRPMFVDTNVIDIVQGRHPIVESCLPSGFVPNDVFLDQEKQNSILLTGPNMAGKSTVMRQTALIVVMAQMGSFVPAQSVKLSPVDQIFTRIGAQDEVTKGRSTFMVEMNETAYILSHATKQSLVLLDEIGRGTSTYDGVSIAWAVASYLHDRICAKTIFATHYHELLELTKNHKRMKSFKMNVRKWKDEIIFLRTMEEGSVERSYGIEVAQLAGLPSTVIQQAKSILSTLESSQHQVVKTQDKPLQSRTENHWIESELQKIQPDDLSPKSALEILYRLKNQLPT